MQRTIERFIETGLVHDRPSRGKPKTVRRQRQSTQFAVRKQKVMDREINISKRSYPE